MQDTKYPHPSYPRRPLLQDDLHTKHLREREEKIRWVLVKRIRCYIKQVWLGISLSIYPSRYFIMGFLSSNNYLF